MTRDLNEVQNLLYRLVSAPEGVTRRLRDKSGLLSGGIETIIRGDGRMGVVKRLEIYAEAYFYRLLDCLKEDFPATLAVLGTENFELLVREYLIEFPPTEPSIFYAGRFLAAFLGRHRFGRHWPFAEDLARLERTAIEVFHGPDAVPLGATAMRSVPPERWSTFRLRRHPASKILECRWKVTEVLRQVNEKQSWRHPCEERSDVLVFRQDAEVYFRKLEPVEREALRLVNRPTAFADLCELIVNRTTAADPSAEINRMLHRWLADGIMIAISK